MIILTGKKRSSIKADKAMSHVGFAEIANSHCRWTNTLAWDVEGSDGLRYKLHFTLEDLAELNKAAVRFDTDMKRVIS